MEQNETWKQKIILWAKNKLIVDKEIFESNMKIRGIYGIFLNKKCVYVGKSSNIHERMFNTRNGHITKLQQRDHFIKDLNYNTGISIRILKKVPYKFDNYYKDLQRLASVETKIISKYQRKNQCLEQVPEGKHITLEKWKDLKDKNSKKCRSIFRKLKCRI